MARVTRSNPKAFDTLLNGLKALDGLEAKTGWFASSVYENGMPVAAVAAINELGAVIDHPGGTAYQMTPEGARFVSNNDARAASLPRTKAHKIVIPPRPFFRPTIIKQTNEWLRMLREGSLKVIKGTMSAKDVLDLVSAQAAADVAKTISQITDPPLAASTVAARRRAMSNKKVVGDLTKPLVASGKMLDELTNVVEKAS